MVLKSGEVIVDQGDLRDSRFGKTLHVEPEYDTEVEADIRKWFEQRYSVRWRNYPVDKNFLPESEATPC